MVMRKISRTLHTRAALAALLSVFAAACTSTASEPAQTAASSPKLNCSAPPKVKDIWALEPMLTEKGLIVPSMSSEEKETVIRDYIRKKDEAFKNCNKKSSPQ